MFGFCNSARVKYVLCKTNIHYICSKEKAAIFLKSCHHRDKQILISVHFTLQGTSAHPVCGRATITYCVHP